MHPRWMWSLLQEMPFDDNDVGDGSRDLQLYSSSETLALNITYFKILLHVPLPVRKSWHDELNSINNRFLG